MTTQVVPERPYYCPYCRDNDDGTGGEDVPGYHFATASSGKPHLLCNMCGELFEGDDDTATPRSSGNSTSI
jgi:hypothetical protein